MRAATATLRALYDFHGIDTCAACGLCATACPVGIETGLLIKALRGRRAGPLAKRVAARGGEHFGAMTAGVRAGLAAADLLHGLVGTRLMQRSLDGMRGLSGGADAQVVARVAAPGQFQARAAAATRRARTRRLLSQLRRPHHGGATRRRRSEALPVAAERLFAQSRIRRRLSRRARGSVLRPAVREQGALRARPMQVGGARGRVARRQRRRALADRVRHESMHLPDAAPCRRAAAGAGQHRVHPRSVLPRVAIAPRREPVAIHPVCSVRKMGTVDKLDGHRRALQRRSHRGRRGAVLRLRGRQGLQSPGAERVRAAPSEGRACRPAACMAIRRAAPARSACPSRRAFPTGRSSIWSTRARASRASAELIDADGSRQSPEECIP